MPTDTNQQPTSPPNPEIITLTLGDRVYELVPILQPVEDSISGDEMVKRAHQLNANLGEEDARHIIRLCRQIPVELQEYALIFTGWRHSGLSRLVAYLHSMEGLWFKRWESLSSNYSEGEYLVRRIK